MREKKPSGMSEKEYEIVELLRKLDINRPVALTLACLSSGEEITSREIEMNSSLRQPEVSIAMRYLKDNNWVDIREEKKTEGKGRPVKLYRLITPLEDIVQSIEQRVLLESRYVLNNIEKLKRLA
ncbi:transcriptional regulator [Methanolobus vulcani]|jgi:predicted transcriptional regulator|uniref:Transcriptional regulator n=1 Tax=Methanolobus vulcani TaxID=38026 RepID=A0A7Z8KNW9_9EURY|nr:transcriptional regulator [Methanolobus vulcani]TQD26172.1 transcriptional regulator [Methanolobus vulcani]